jgi:hypothetical protein
MTSNSQQSLTTIVNRIARFATKTRSKYDQLRDFRLNVKLIVFRVAFKHDVRRNFDKRKNDHSRDFDYTRNKSAIRTCSRLIDFAISQRTNRSRNKLTTDRANERAKNET